MKATCGSNDGTGVETAQAKAMIVQHPHGFGIGFEKNLKSPIKPEPADDVCADASANGVVRFNYSEGDIRERQVTGTGQATEARTDNRNMRSRR